MLSNAIPYFDKHVLVCPLDWGLGHAARCVPLIKQLQAQKNRVTIACTAWQEDFLKNEITDAVFVRLFGYNVRYSKKISLGLKMLWQFPRLSLLVKKENAWLKSFLKKNSVDVVISDNRFGLYNKTVETVFITHQLFIPAPFLKGAVNKLNFSFIKKYDHCWVPDYENENKSLSGNLAHGPNLPDNIKFIGPLSRFYDNTQQSGKDIDLLLLLSGVEPLRTTLEKTLVEALRETPLKITLIRGTDKSLGRKYLGHFTVLNTANTSQLLALLPNAKKIICRSGYSTLMDLHALNLKALLIPTPGQAEQEYLGVYWKEKFGFGLLEQKNIDPKTLASAIGSIENHLPQKQSA